MHTFPEQYEAAIKFSRDHEMPITLATAAKDDPNAAAALTDYLMETSHPLGLVAEKANMQKRRKYWDTAMSRWGAVSILGPVAPDTPRPAYQLLATPIKKPTGRTYYVQGYIPRRTPVGTVHELHAELTGDELKSVLDAMHRDGVEKHNTELGREFWGEKRQFDT